MSVSAPVASELYRLEPAELDAAWDRFVASSPHGSLFATCDFLRQLDVRPITYYCLKGERIKAAVLVTCTAPRDDRPQFVIYDGLLTAGRESNDLREETEDFEVSTFVVEALAQRHPYLEMQLAPEFRDIRPFLWYNFGSERPRFSVDVRYTAYLDIADLATDEEAALQRAKSMRRQVIRKAEALRTDESFEPDLFLTLYSRTMARQGIQVEREFERHLGRVMSGLHEVRRGRMFITRGQSGDPASAAFMGIHGRRAYFLYGANDPQFREEPTGTAVLWQAFRALSAAGVHGVDLEGVNSPRRGAFKLSFGATLVPYFRLALDGRTGPHG